MDFRILGPLEVLDERRALPLGGSRQRALLALLLLHANEALTLDRLVDELWGQAPPSAPAKTLRTHVSRLRRVLGGAADGGLLVTREHAYELRIDPQRLDARRFERLLAQGREALAGDDNERAVATLDQALALWRGPPLADLAAEPFAQREAARLDDLRLAALEQLVEAKLRLGRHLEVIGPLEALVAEQPYREGLRAQLMLALYRADRQAEALQAYQDARRRLVDELGIEPGERLRALERAIRAQDPALVIAAAPPAPRREQPGRLPSGVVTFLLTDIEGSTALWEMHGSAMAAALERHDELVAATIAAHGGTLLKSKGEGDSTLSAFARASDAVAAAGALQRALADGEWPAGVRLRVRIGVHTGEAHERDGDYFGPTLNRAARLRGVASGGTIVLSQATAEVVRDRLPAGMVLVSIGRHRLRGIARAEPAFELRGADGGDGRRPATAPTRKVVTAVLVTLCDAPDAGTTLDPEARRGLTARCLAQLRDTLQRHEATVSAYPGDGLLGVFGIPVLHEDDALRAVRAATEMRAALAALGDETDRRYGLRPGLRAGIATGEVLDELGDDGVTTAIADAVRLARPLEAVAEGGEILVDEPTRRLTHGAATVEPVPVRHGRDGGAVAVARVVSAEPPAAGRRPRLDAPLVGRDRQLGVLTDVVAAATRDRTCHLVTVLGAAGVGKSRLVAELVAGLEPGVTVLHGRCLPYGEGITYWPLAEVVRELAGDEPDLLVAIAGALGGDPRRDEAVAAIGEALGVAGGTDSTSERIAWAVRRLLEAVAQAGPLVVVLDDLHWAEPTFLELVEQVAELSRSAPIVILCMARPELLDLRPGWGGGMLNATTVLLEPLAEDDGARLVASLLAGAQLPGEVAHRIAQASEGNPLFAEELLAELLDTGRLRREDGRWTAGGALDDLPVPATIHALLAARLERLPDDERALLARAAVEGVVFHGDAALALAPSAVAPEVERILTALVRRDLVQPARPALEGRDAYRFRHALIRDAAYRSLSKELRADLHARFAAWLEDAAGARLGELEEIAGYHLERAWLLLDEIGGAAAERRALADRGARRLESAGRRALARSDRAAATALLERALRLLGDDDPRRARLLADLGAALISAGRLADAGEALARAGAAATALDDDVAAAHALVERQVLALQRGEAGATETAERAVAHAEPVFRRAGDHLGLCRALGLRAWLRWVGAQAAAAAASWEEAAEHAGRAGADSERIAHLGWIASAQFFGPTPVPQAIARCEAIREQVAGQPEAVASVLQPLAALHAMAGRFDRARELLAASDAVFAELGLALHSAVSHHAAIVELLAGDPVAAERGLRRGLAVLERMGERAVLATTAAFLGRALVEQGRHGEAERCADQAAELTLADDRITEILWRGVRARALAARGAHAQAERLAREGLDLARTTDFTAQRADASLDLALVLAEAGRAAASRAALADALAAYEAKGDVVSAGRLRARLASDPRV